MSEDEPALIHDWDDRGVPSIRTPRIQDETLREGLQSPFATDPGDERKVELLLLMERLGIEHASVGIPAAGERARESARRLCREIDRRGLRIRPNAGGRTAESDVRAILELSERVAAPVDAFLFLGSSPIRAYAEGWDLELLRQRTRSSVRLAAGEGLVVTYILEDTTRSRPEDLEVLFGEAIDAGAAHVCVCDTVGCATPRGAGNLVRWSRERLDRLAPDVGLDWHGHDDRGLGLANALAAIEAGVDRVHVTALGLGERAGNTATEQLLVNLRLLGLEDRDLTALPAYAAAASAATGVPVPHDAPVVGSEVFRTATGVHAAAIAKARALGEEKLADLVYCGVPASWVGREQEILVGPLSGSANVRAWMVRNGIAAEPEAVDRVLAVAKSLPRTLTDEEVLAALGDVRRESDDGSTA